MVAPKASLLLLGIMLAAAYAASRPDGTPEVKLDVPADFAHSLSVQYFQRGEDVLHIDWMPTPARAAMTRSKGYWYSDGSRPNTDHGWTIDVFSTHSQKVATAYEHASSGYAADLDEVMDFLTIPRASSLFDSPRRALSYLFARFERKSLRWGNAVSFFSQGVQDTAMPEPANGRLTYEIFGVTRDGRFTVIASLSASHPKLPDDTDARDMRDGMRDDDPGFGQAYYDAARQKDYQRLERLQDDRDKREAAAMREQPGVKLIETCSPDDFQPSLAAFDRVVDSLVVR